MSNSDLTALENQYEPDSTEDRYEAIYTCSWASTCGCPPPG